MQKLIYEFNYLKLELAWCYYRKLHRPFHLKLLSLLLFIAFIFSCGNDDTAITERFEIPIVTYGNSENSILLVTNEEKEVLYSKIGVGDEETIIFDALADEQIDLTYGVIFGSLNSFRINTYRNISPDFVFDRILTCFDFAELTPFNYSIKKLTIENFTGELIYSPLSDSTRIGNKLEMSGITINDDIVITFLDSKGVYKSKLIEKEDWTLQNDDSYALTLDGNDFKDSKVHFINTNVVSDWFVAADVIQMDGTALEISQKLGKSQKRGFQVKLFLPDELEFQSANLSFESGSFLEGYDYNIRNITEFPTNVDFVESDFDFVNCSPTQYEIENRISATQIRVDYAYRFENRLSFWYIFQKRENELEYSLPPLPDLFLDEIDQFRDALQNPEWMSARFAQTEDLNSSEKYFENAGDQMLCIEHRSAFEGKTF